MVLGTTTSILLGLGAAGAGVGASKLMAGKSGVSSMIPLPQPPAQTNAVGKAEEVVKKKRAAATQSVYTSPLGVAGEAQIAKKILLGQ